MRFQPGIRVVGRAVCAILWLVSSHASPAIAQTDASISGYVADQSGAVLPRVSVVVLNLDTGLRRAALTDDRGYFVFPSLSPGRYELNATLVSFKPTVLPDIVLNVGDRRALRISLSLASVDEAVNVEAGSPQVNTSPAVATTVDRQFVGNIPLNGRSLQSLLELAPGVTLFKSDTDYAGGGQFSVNGQRTDTNYFTVDGVAGNTAISAGNLTYAGQSAGGVLPALTALGTTQSLISIDALQEFKIQTSSYAPEFGRTPGAQVSLLTRSGSNSLHGSASEYFRHDALDAKDWFANRENLPKSRLRQHDFGVTLGGPLRRSSLFFFASYEGLRLDLPETQVVTVPSLSLRSAAAASLKPFLSSFPLPTGAENEDGTAPFAAAYSDPSTSDAFSVRLDQTMGARGTVFTRYSHSPSQSATRSGSLSTITNNDSSADSLTTGTTWILGSRITNDARVNVTRSRTRLYLQADTFGGATLLTDDLVFPSPLTPVDSQFSLGLDGTNGLAIGSGGDNLQRQLNVVDTFSAALKSHLIKTGVDYRRLSPIVGRSGGNYDAFTLQAADVTAGTIALALLGRGNSNNVVNYTNVSTFIQDTWAVLPRLSLTYGVRWDVNPAPRSENGKQPPVLQDVNVVPATFGAPGAPLWKTNYNDIAPRVGGALQIGHVNGRELTVKGGFGQFYDASSGLAAVAFDHVYPYSIVTAVCCSVAFPFAPGVADPPIPGSSAPSLVWATDRNLKSPYTYQWNVTAEQALGDADTLSISYVGAAGRRQLRIAHYGLAFAAFGSKSINVDYTSNATTSDYKALQIQLRRRLARGLQAMVNYSLASSHDTASSDTTFQSSDVPGATNVASDYGPSDFDVRHTVSGAVTYDVPALRQDGPLCALTCGWGLDVMLRARSAFPLNLLTQVRYLTSAAEVRVDVVPGVPQILYSSQYPGGMALNRAAFRAPSTNAVGDYPRNSLRGFGAQQVDLAFRRQIAVGDAYRVQLRLELFNALNHPNFADPELFLSGSDFGQSSQMLNRGLGGLNALYQVGGPRSIQLSARINF